MTGRRPPAEARLFEPDAARSGRIGRARRGYDKTLRAMRQTGRLEAVDSALVALGRVTVDELDAAITDPDESRYTVGVLVARYHAVLSHLLARPDDADDGGDLERLFAEVDHPPESVGSD
jgi:hypothetical protein